MDRQITSQFKVRSRTAKKNGEREKVKNVANVRHALLSALSFCKLCRVYLQGSRSSNDSVNVAQVKPGTIGQQG